MIAAGELRHKITIERPIIDQDSTGSPVIDIWQEVGKYWAAIKPLSAKEFIAAQATQSEVIARIVMRKQSDVINASMRIVHNGTIYNIEGILADPDSGLEYITMPVSQGVRNDEAG